MSDSDFVKTLHKRILDGASITSEEFKKVIETLFNSDIDTHLLNKSEQKYPSGIHLSLLQNICLEILYFKTQQEQSFPFNDTQILKLFEILLKDDQNYVGKQLTEYQKVKNNINIFILSIMCYTQSGCFYRQARRFLEQCEDVNLVSANLSLVLPVGTLIGNKSCRILNQKKFNSEFVQIFVENRKLFCKEVLHRLFFVCKVLALQKSQEYDLLKGFKVEIMHRNTYDPEKISSKNQANDIKDPINTEKFTRSASFHFPPKSPHVIPNDWINQMILEGLNTQTPLNYELKLSKDVTKKDNRILDSSKVISLGCLLAILAEANAILKNLDMDLINIIPPEINEVYLSFLSSLAVNSTTCFKIWESIANFGIFTKLISQLKNLISIMQQNDSVCKEKDEFTQYSHLRNFDCDSSVDFRWVQFSLSLLKKLSRYVKEVEDFTLGNLEIFVALSYSQLPLGMLREILDILIILCKEEQHKKALCRHLSASEIFNFNFFNSTTHRNDKNLNGKITEHINDLKHKLYNLPQKNFDARNNFHCETSDQRKLDQIYNTDSQYQLKNNIINRAGSEYENNRFTFPDYFGNTNEKIHNERFNIQNNTENLRCPIMNNQITDQFQDRLYRSHFQGLPTNNYPQPGLNPANTTFNDSFLNTKNNSTNEEKQNINRPTSVNTFSNTLLNYGIGEFDSRTWNQNRNTASFDVQQGFGSISSNVKNHPHADNQLPEFGSTKNIMSWDNQSQIQTQNPFNCLNVNLAYPEISSDPFYNSRGSVYGGIEDLNRKNNNSERNFNINSSFQTGQDVSEFQNEGKNLEKFSNFQRLLMAIQKSISGSLLTNIDFIYNPQARLLQKNVHIYNNINIFEILFYELNSSEFILTELYLKILSQLYPTGHLQQQTINFLWFVFKLNSPVLTTTVLRFFKYKEVLRGYNLINSVEKCLLNDQNIGAVFMSYCCKMNDVLRLKKKPQHQTVSYFSNHTNYNPTTDLRESLINDEEASEYHDRLENMHITDNENSHFVNRLTENHEPADLGTSSFNSIDEDIIVSFLSRVLRNVRLMTRLIDCNTPKCFAFLNIFKKDELVLFLDDNLLKNLEIFPQSGLSFFIDGVIASNEYGQFVLRNYQFFDSIKTHSSLKITLFTYLTDHFISRFTIKLIQTKKTDQKISSTSSEAKHNSIKPIKESSENSKMIDDFDVNHKSNIMHQKTQFNDAKIKPVQDLNEFHEKEKHPRDQVNIRHSFIPNFSIPLLQTEDFFKLLAKFLLFEYVHKKKIDKTFIIQNPNINLHNIDAYIRYLQVLHVCAIDIIPFIHKMTNIHHLRSYLDKIVDFHNNTTNSENFIDLEKDHNDVETIGIENFSFKNRKQKFMFLQKTFRSNPIQKKCLYNDLINELRILATIDKYSDSDIMLIRQIALKLFEFENLKEACDVFSRLKKHQFADILSRMYIMSILNDQNIDVDFEICQNISCELQAQIILSLMMKRRFSKDLLIGFAKKVLQQESGETFAQILKQKLSVKCKS